MSERETLATMDLLHAACRRHRIASSNLQVAEANYKDRPSDTHALALALAWRNMRFSVDELVAMDLQAVIGGDDEVGLAT